jgi:hypothetical protein
LAFLAVTTDTLVGVDTPVMAWAAGLLALDDGAGAAGVAAEVSAVEAPPPHPISAMETKAAATAA